jgi:alpha-N-arabinofuranosidase
MDFAELIGAEAYVSGNVGNGTPQEMAEWVEYMTSPANRRWPRSAPRTAAKAPWKLRLVRHRQRAMGLRRQHAAPNMPPTSTRRYGDVHQAFPSGHQDAEDRQRRQRRRL